MNALFTIFFIIIITFTFCVNAQNKIESIYYQKVKLNNYNRDYSLKYNGTLKPSFNKFPKILYLKTDATFIEVSPENYRNTIKYNLDSGRWKLSKDTIFFNYFPKQQISIKSKITNEKLFIVLFNINGDNLLDNYSINIYYKNEVYNAITNNIGEINLNINSFDSIYVYDNQLTQYPLRIYNLEKLANYFEIYIYKKGYYFIYDKSFLYNNILNRKEKYFKKKNASNKYIRLYNQLIDEQKRNSSKL